MTKIKPQRNEALDGFRGLAIFAVVAFHYLADLARRPDRSSTFYPFGDAYYDVPFLVHGHMGVLLFFMISGFVISLTLETSRSPWDFAVKRLARLVPALFLCSLLTAAVLTLSPYKSWQVQPLDFLPSWSFTSEHSWSAMLGRPVFLVDPVYWTLAVEVKFYLLAAIVHFYVRRVSLMTFLFALMCAQVVVAHLFFKAPDASELFKDWSLYEFTPLFLAGVAFRRLSAERKDWKAIFYVAASMLLLMVRAKSGWYQDALIVLFYSMFAGMIYAPRTVAVFTWKPIVALGVWSYALYLLHNRIGITLTYDLGMVAPDWVRHSILIPLVVAAFLTFASMLVFRYWEVPARNLIRRLATDSIRQRLPLIHRARALPIATQRLDEEH